MGETRNAHKILVVKPEWRIYISKELGVDWRIILRWILGE
jgi:hypothetical protein